ncbi:MAG: immunity 49 family protein [Bacteroidota bacterium]
MKDITELVIINSLISSPSKPLVTTCLIYDFDISLAHFKQVLTQEESIEVTLGKRRCIVPSVDSKHKADAASWIRMFSIAMILRDKHRMEATIAILDQIFEDDRFASAWANYLGAIYLENDPKRREMLDILNEDAKTDQGVFIGLEGNSTTLIPGRAESLTRISLPWIHLYELVKDKNEAGFNEKLFEYQKDKKDYLIQLEWEDKRKYWIDLFSTACCSYAIDHGLKIQVESEYIPRWLFEEELSQYDLVF